MGIRIHKALGYGLSDVKVEKYRITDDRFFDQSAFMIEIGYNQIDGGYYESAESIYSLDGYIKYVKSRSKIDYRWIIPMKSIGDYRWSLSRNFIHESESELNNVFIVVPPFEKQWYRFDDIIDYVEEDRGTLGDKLKILQQGIWPFSSMHQDKRDLEGKALDMRSSCFWWRMFNSILDGDVQQEEALTISTLLEYLSKEMGFKSFHDAKDNMIPWIPDRIRYFCEYTNLFNSNETINELRPMLFTYWS